MPVEGDAMFDVVFIIWDVIFNEVKNRKDKKLDEIIKSLCQLFCIRYTISSKKKRKILLYHAVSLLCENINYKTNVFENINILQTIKNKIDLIYKQIKIHEIVESEESLRNKEIQENIKGNKNFQNSFKKIQMVANNDFL
jgi:hypothetical protein